jgi:hypothetical protein
MQAVQQDVHLQQQLLLPRLAKAAPMASANPKQAQQQQQQQQRQRLLGKQALRQVVLLVVAVQVAPGRALRSPWILTNQLRSKPRCHPHRPAKAGGLQHHPQLAPHPPSNLQQQAARQQQVCPVLARSAQLQMQLLRLQPMAAARRRQAASRSRQMGQKGSGLVQGPHLLVKQQPQQVQLASRDPASRMQQQHSRLLSGSGNNQQQQQQWVAAVAAAGVPACQTPVIFR